jgi:hypothetical protein
MPNNAGMLPSSLARQVVRPLRTAVAPASLLALPGREAVAKPVAFAAPRTPACGIRIGRIVPRGRRIEPVVVGRSMPCAPRELPDL